MELILTTYNSKEMIRILIGNLNGAVIHIKKVSWTLEMIEDLKRFKMVLRDRISMENKLTDTFKSHCY